MRKNIHRQFLGFLCAVMCACFLAVPCFAADASAPDPGISFYMENINDAQCVLTVQNGKASASASVTGRRGAERCKIVLEIPALFVLNWLFPLYGLAYAQFVAELILGTIAVVVLVRMFRRLEREHAAPYVSDSESVK